MASSCPEELEAARQLNVLVAALGLSHVVYLLAQLAEQQSDVALAAFATDLGERMADVVVLTMSEFGRTIAENGNAGTDHGHATAMMLLGGETAGGRVHGRWPTLDPAARFEGRDLAVTTDFRALFGEVLSGHFGAVELGSVFPGFQPPGARVGVMR